MLVWRFVLLFGLFVVGICYALLLFYRVHVSIVCYVVVCLLLFVSMLCSCYIYVSLCCFMLLQVALLFVFVVVGLRVV